MEDSWLAIFVIVAILGVIARVMLVVSAAKRMLHSLLRQRTDAMTALQKQLQDAQARGAAIGSDERTAITANWQQVLQLQQSITAASNRSREFEAAQAARSSAFECEMASIKGQAAANGLFL